MMFARTEQDSRELFRPEPRSLWHPDRAFLWLLILMIVTGPLAALAAIVAYVKFAWDDFQTAIWMLRNDPVRGRGRAVFWFCLSRANLNVVVAATSVAIIVDNPMSWHIPFDWKVPTILFAGIVAHVAFAVAGWRSASQQKVRVWIDSGLNRARKERTWPPLCDSAHNDAMNLVLVTTVLFVVIFILGLDALATAFTEYELPAAAILTATVFGPLLLTRRALAATPDECWSAGKSVPLTLEG